MKRTIMNVLLALILSGLTASACLVQVRIACPNDTAASGVLVCIKGAYCMYTDDLGIANIWVPNFGTYTVTVDKSTLPPGAILSPASQNIKVVDEAPPVLNFTLGGNICSTPPPQGPCWMTGGGTIGTIGAIGKNKGTPNYSFGGVVYPGCSPNAADGGNWNVVDHSNGLHFQGQQIIVDACSGVPTGSPSVNVNIIDFHGFGILAGGSSGTIPVSFVGRAIDNHESGGGSDQLYLVVSDSSNNIVMQIGSSVDSPATISTGNLQIHTTSCNN